jgi:single-strand DNA-binding protein
MGHIAKATISGVLTRDPSLKELPSGAKVAELSIASERRVKVGEEWESKTSYFDVSVFGLFAETVDKKLRKGDNATVAGRLEQQRWQNGEGQNRSKVVIVADDIDSQAFFRKADGSDTPKREERDEANGAATQPAATPANEAPASGAPANDGIPF